MLLTAVLGSWGMTYISRCAMTMTLKATQSKRSTQTGPWPSGQMWHLSHESSRRKFGKLLSFEGPMVLFSTPQCCLESTIDNMNTNKGVVFQSDCIYTQAGATFGSQAVAAPPNQSSLQCPCSWTTRWLTFPASPQCPCLPQFLLRASSVQVALQKQSRHTSVGRSKATFHPQVGL